MLSRFFTPSETRVILFITIAISMGSIVKFVKAGFGQDVQIERVNNIDSVDNNISSKIAFSKVNINTADAKELSRLPKIGEIRANEIIDYRVANGNFKSKSEIINVQGIGKKTFELLEDKIEVKSDK